MEIQIAVAKINKYDSLESGDTLEFVERPSGGVSVVMVDAQTSGRSAKLISSAVVRKAISLLAEGVRDGAAARASSDYLYTERNGKVSAYLNIFSVDFLTNTVVITRNNPTPILLAYRDKIEYLSGESMPIGVTRNIRPTISEITLEPGMTVAIFTDGLLHAGKNCGLSLDIPTLFESLLEEQSPSAQEIADTILSEAIRLDQCRPFDDMCLVVLRVQPEGKDRIRRMNITLPIIREFQEDYE